MDFVEILKQHSRKYPLMQPCDVVKLIYQSEFGGGHFIADAAGCLRRLTQEYANVTPDPDAPLLEEIGGGMVRVHLAALKEESYPLEQLCSDFIRCAHKKQGSREDFERKLQNMMEHFDQFSFAFTAEEMRQYLRQYRKEGCPVVSHSAEFRAAYHPAYRVICKAETEVDLPKK